MKLGKVSLPCMLKVKTLIIVALFSLGFHAQAETVFETSAAISTIDIDFPTTGSGLSARPGYVFAVRLPEEIVFDRIQIQITSATVTKNLYAETYNKGTNWIYSDACLNNQISTCNGSGSRIKEIGYGSPTRVASTTIQYLFNSTTTVTTESFLYFYFDGNSPYQDLQIASVNYSQAAILNGNGWILGNTLPVMKLCNGACDNNNFTPLPLPTEYPWVRLASPSTNQILIGDTNFSFQVNTGTTTAIDNLRVTLNSSIQSLGYFDIPITSDGISFHNYNFSFPDIADIITVVPSLMVGTSTVEIGSSYQFTVTDSTGDIPLGIDKSSCEFSLFEMSSWWDCLVGMGRYMIIPSTESINEVIALRDDVSTRWPFIYAFEFGDIVTDLYSGVGTASSSISYDFAGLGQLELISVNQIEAVPYTSWVKTTIGLLMWLMFGSLMYNRVLRIFNTNPQ